MKQISNPPDSCKTGIEFFVGIIFKNFYYSSFIMDNDKQKLPIADTGNASNPSPHNNNQEPVNSNQLLNKKAENYLRESANIEDEPDAQDQQDADEVIRKNNNH
jgi:hypothetical protein